MPMSLYAFQIQLQFACVLNLIAFEVDFDGFGDFGNREGLALDLAERDGRDHKTSAQDFHKLAQVHFGHQDFLVAAQDRAEVGRQGVEKAQMNVSDRLALAALALDGALDRAEGAAPADDEQVAGQRPVDGGGRNLASDTVDLGLAQEAHGLVIVALIADIAAVLVLLDSANAVPEAGRADADPGTGERVGVAFE